MITQFSGKLRVRACGVLLEDQGILMVKHRGLGKEGYLWIPPGGGVEHGQSLEETVTREFKEETGLQVVPTQFLFLNEFIDGGLHALEVFLKVVKIGGELITGYDPEMKSSQQIIEEARYLTIQELRSEGSSHVHARFCDLSSLDELSGVNGFFNFKNICLK